MKIVVSVVLLLADIKVSFGRISKYLWNNGGQIPSLTWVKYVLKGFFEVPPHIKAGLGCWKGTSFGRDAKGRFFSLFLFNFIKDGNVGG